MREQDPLTARWKKISEHLKRGKYAIVILLVGALFLLWPDTQPEEHSAADAPAEEDFSVEALEEKLEQTLTRIDGAGQVHVMLTVQSGMKRVLAQDASLEQKADCVQRESQTVVISSGSGTQETVLIQQIYPQFQGALVVADGGGDPAVKLKLTEAVAALTGLGTDKISICKGK